MAINPQETPQPSPAPSKASGLECFCAGKGWRQLEDRGFRYYDGEQAPRWMVAGSRSGEIVMDESHIADHRQYCYCELGESMLPQGQERDREREARTRQDRRDRIERLKEQYFEAANFPLKFIGYELESCPALQARDGLLQRFKKSPEDDSWYLWGKFGTGKTGIAVAYGMGLIEDNDPDSVPTSVLFRRVPDLFTELRASYNPRRDDDPTESDLLAKYCDVGLLILDDIGAEQIKDSGWLEDRLYQIIGRRHDELQPVFVTSNLSPAQLGARIGERIMWRLVEMCGEDNIVELKGENLRALKRGLRDE